MGALRRSHACGEVNSAQVGSEVIVAGWVQRRRDHGGVIFIDLRDARGLVQVVFRPEESPESHERAGEIRSEYVILVRGTVQQRTPDTVNPAMATGEIEVVAREIRLLNRATPPPFPLEDDPDVDESTRLRYRIHDLRRGPLQRNLRMRHDVYQVVRRALSNRGFLEIETPVLAKATPEGARDFLVPSRLQPREFYALPQSPQLMKQLLMVAGYDRYFQIVRCFRDEDQRADRQLEFTQIDLEMAFVGVEDVLEVLENLTSEVFREILDVEISRPFRRISCADALARYGTDRPDTRIQLELVDLTDVFAQSEFRAFRSAVDRGGIVKCLPIHDAKELGRGVVDRLEKFVKKELGAMGLAWIRVGEDGTWQSPVVKFFSETERSAILERTDARAGSLLFFQADAAPRANAVLSRLRTDLGRELGRMDDRRWDVLFVVDYPVFEPDDEGGLTYVHQPFVAPIEEDIPLLATAPEQVRGTHYDVVVNGVELGSGSLRNHQSDVQRRILEIMGYSKEEAEARFGFLLNALDAGAPPHGGFAYGLDRWIMVLADVGNLRDVIAFPKTQRGQDLLMDAPTSVDQSQLDELEIRIAPVPKKGG